MTTVPDTITYRATAISIGGRTGSAKTADGSLVVALEPPAELGGNAGGSTPEDLFALAYAACFNDALKLLAPRADVDVSRAEVVAVVGFGPEGVSSALTVELTITIPGTAKELARQVAEAAHAICPLSKAIKGNVPVTVSTLDG